MDRRDGERLLQNFFKYLDILLSDCDKIIHGYYSGLFLPLLFDSVIPSLVGDNSRHVPIDAYFNP